MKIFFTLENFVWSEYYQKLYYLVINIRYGKDAFGNVNTINK